MNAYELADWMEWWTENKPYPEENLKIIDMLRQQADRIADLEKSSMAWYEAGKFVSPQIKELSDEQNNLKWWISSFEHLKALGGGISNEMETNLKEMKEKLKKASEK